MKELFFQKVSVLALILVLLIILWLILVICKKGEKLWLWIFLISNYTLYIDSFIFSGRSFVLVGSIILTVTLIAYFINVFKKKKPRFFALYVLNFVVLSVLVLYVVLLSQMDISFLALY